MTNLTPMTARLKFLIFYLFTWVVFFQFARIIFFLSHLNETAKLKISTILGSFFYGLRMDLSMAAYFTVPVCLFVLLSTFLPLFRKSIIYTVYTSILVFIILLILVADIEIFNQWGFRIDASPLKYLSSPKEAWASVSHLPVFLYLFLFLVFFLLVNYFMGKLIRRIISYLQTPVPVLPALLIPIVFAGLMIIPIRGGLQLTPMNQSIVYFSANNFANQAAVNATWNLMYTLVSETGAGRNPYEYMPANEAAMIKDSLYASGNKTLLLLNTAKPNIVLIIWESFTAKATALSINGEQITPHFNQLKNEGVYFSNAYASGDRTDKGIAAVLSGYPALPKTSVIRLPSKVTKLETITGVYKKQGYHTSFYYGGETEFANIKSYILHNGFDHITDKSTFSSKDLNSKWGAHDGVVAKKILSELSQQQEPFFSTWLTLSSHEPFETPVQQVFHGKDHTTKFLNSLHYTDAVLFDFIESCKKLPSWKNTIVVIVADHGHPLPETGSKLDNFKIPILFLGGALKQQGIIIDAVCSQIDIAATLTHQTATSANFPFSKNILDSSASKWAFFTFNDGFGFIQPHQPFLFDNVGKIPLPGYAKDSALLRAGKAMQQFTYQDYVDK
jgi:phosphoglycerol transferase MdoB-like AlkP superfamily enzyme